MNWRYKWALTGKRSWRNGMNHTLR